MKTITFSRLQTVVLSFDDGAIPADTKIDWLEWWIEKGNMGQSMVDMIKTSAPDRISESAEKWEVMVIDGRPVEKIEGVRRVAKAAKPRR